MSDVFRASRLTSGNFLFPTEIEVTDQAVIRRKRTWFHRSETSIHLSRVASVAIETGPLFSDIRIESSGGGDDIVSHGHTSRDARRIQELIQAWQSSHLGPERGTSQFPSSRA